MMYDFCSLIFSLGSAMGTTSSIHITAGTGQMASGVYRISSTDLGSIPY